MLTLHGGILHDVFSPQGARETDRIAAILELLDNGIRELRTQQITILIMRILAHHIMEGSILVAVSLLYHLGRSQDTP